MVAFRIEWKSLSKFFIDARKNTRLILALADRRRRLLSQIATCKDLNRKWGSGSANIDNAQIRLEEWNSGLIREKIRDICVMIVKRHVEGTFLGGIFCPQHARKNATYYMQLIFVNLHVTYLWQYYFPINIMYMKINILYCIWHSS